MVVVEQVSSLRIRAFNSALHQGGDIRGVAGCHERIQGGHPQSMGGFAVRHHFELRTG
jgi:hypothetical protein